MKILSVIGTRPEAIKMAPVIHALAKQTAVSPNLVCLSGQHREMLEPILQLFSIRADYQLAVMRPEQSLNALTAKLLEQLDTVLAEAQPDWVLAQGDTHTVLAASLAAYHRRLRFAHIEAGLRTGDKFKPFPEELNRRWADVAADLCFAPTERARQSLLREGCEPERIHVTGNTGIDALLEVAARPFDWRNSPLAPLVGAGRMVLVTAHRRESFGPGLEEICEAIRKLALTYRRSDVRFIYPVHLNPQARQPAEARLADLENVALLAPLDYFSMVHLMKRATVILTDSGGIQEEAPSLGKPVLVMRDTTERPEGVELGLARLVGTDQKRIIAETTAVLEQGWTGRKDGRNPYGDGQAASRIVSLLLGQPASPYGSADLAAPDRMAGPLRKRRATRPQREF